MATGRSFRGQAWELHFGTRSLHLLDSTLSHSPGSAAIMWSSPAKTWEASHAMPEPGDDDGPTAGLVFKSSGAMIPCEIRELHSIPS